MGTGQNSGWHLPIQVFFQRILILNSLSRILRKVTRFIPLLKDQEPSTLSFHLIFIERIVLSSTYKLKETCVKSYILWKFGWSEKNKLNDFLRDKLEHVFSRRGTGRKITVLFKETNNNSVVFVFYSLALKFHSLIKLFIKN